MKIAAPAAFATALRLVGQRWARDGRAEPQWHFAPAFGEEGSVSARVAAGEAFDVVVLPITALQAQADARRVVPSSVCLAFRAGIGVAVPSGHMQHDMSSPQALREVLAGATRIACTAAASGVHLREHVLPALGLVDATRNRLLQVESGDVAAALAAGQATLGIQLLCELIGRPGITVLGPLPADLQHEVVAAIGVGAASRCVEAAHAFIHALRAPALAPLLRAAGLEPAQ